MKLDPLRLRFPEEYSGPLYSRRGFVGRDYPIRGHIVNMPSGTDIRLGVAAARDALDLDFSRYTSRPDVSDRIYVPRPGFYVTQLARALFAVTDSFLIVNANNVGYWGNQFLISGGRLVYKTTTPIFSTGNHCLKDTYPFIVQDSTGAIGFERLKIQMSGAWSSFILRFESDRDDPIVSGISGYPLIEEGRPVWKDHVDDAWDPKLLYSLARLEGLGQQDINAAVRAAHDSRQPLQRHGLTFLGIHKTGTLAIVVVEEGPEYSRGIDMDEAANLLLSLDMEFAIVLGGKGDVQMASADEGLLARPLVSEHDRDSARPVDLTAFRNSRIADPKLLERPVPAFLALTALRHREGAHNAR